MSDGEVASSPGNKWWKLFGNKKDKASAGHGGSLSGSSSSGGGAAAAGGGKVFGVSLTDSLVYAAVAISQIGPDGKARIYGHIPVIVAKAGMYLKENGAPFFYL